MSTLLRNICTSRAVLTTSRTPQVTSIILGKKCLATLSQERKAAVRDGPGMEYFMNRSPEIQVVSTPMKKNRKRLPEWLKTEIPVGHTINNIRHRLRDLKLATVCEEARCPNQGACWKGPKGTATATIMILGDTCTRGCRYCAIKTSQTPALPDPNEPVNTAAAVAGWGVHYIVITSVDRDDLADQGCHHIAQTVKEIKKRNPTILAECLSPDFQGNLDFVDVVASSGLEVYAHNMETVERCTPFVRDRRAKYRQSLSVLNHVKTNFPHLITKTSLMLGVGETDDEILRTMEELREINVDALTLGQYMQPTKHHMKVDRYVTPEMFNYWKEMGDKMGFKYTAS
eukprot:Ihof_evm6s282 gene=Ihof_evmTU6s282